MIPALPVMRVTPVTWITVFLFSRAAMQRLKEKLLVTDHACWYLRTFFLKVKKNHFWIDSEENVWAPSRAPQVDSNAFCSNITFEQMAFLFCVTDRIVPIATLMLISSDQAWFWHPDQTQMESGVGQVRGSISRGF